MSSNGDDPDNREERGPLADQLADLEVEVDQRDEESETAETGGEADQQASDQELFREAVDSLDEDEIREAKFDDPTESAEGPTESSVGESSTESAEEGTRHDESAVDARLADQISELEVDSRDLPEDESSTDDRRDEAAGPPEVSPREAFERAIEGMSPAEMRRQKYDMPTADRDQSASGGEEGGDEASSEAQRKRRERAKREELKRRREERKFQEAMRDVDEMDRGQKVRAPSAPDPSSYFDETESARTAADFATPTLAKSGQGLHHVSPLNDVQETMVERAEAADERGELRVLNLRGETAEEATDMLREFIKRCVDDGGRYARLVPGRGTQSEGEPVLKPLVLRWLETKAVDVIRGYAPERSLHGDYGSLIVEFRDC